MTRYFRDTDGAYLGGFDGAEPPAGAIEVPAAPNDARATWNGSAWVEPPPPPHLVPKLLVVERLAAAGRLATARQALNAADDLTRERWDAAKEIASDDTQVRGFLTAIGTDPDVILA